jgi:PAS domain S-box-containing protein
MTFRNKSLIVIPAIVLTIGLMDLLAFHHTEYISMIALLLVSGGLGISLLVAYRSAHAKEAALRASERKFRTVYDNVTDAIFILEPDGRFIDMNRTAHERLGYTKEEMLSLHISDLNAPEFNAGLKERLAGIRDKGHTFFESGHRRKDGSIMPVEVNARAMEFDGRSVFLSVVRDLTERRQADIEIRKTNSRLSTLIQAIPDMVIFKDIEGKHILVNRAVEELVGHSAAEIIGKTAEELMPPGPAAACRLSDETAMHSPIPLHFEERFPAKDGSLLYVDMLKTAMTDDRGEKIGIVIIGRDVTANRRAEEVLRKSEENYRRLVESVNSIVLRWSADEKITFINSFGAKFFGYEPLELLGRSVIGSIVPESDSAGRDLSLMIKGICEMPDQYLSNVNENMLKDGSRVWISWTNKPVMDSEGKLVEILSIGNDITERMQVQDELRKHREELMILVEERTAELSQSNMQLRREIADRERMEQELVKAQKLESLGVLAGGIAHDFNNLLTAILGNISLAQLDTGPDHPAYAELGRADRAALRAQELTQQLLTFSRGGAPVKKTASIADLVRETAEFALRGGRVRCDFDLPEGLRLTDIDTGQMSQVIHNLIINADHAMPDGGTLFVRGENVDLPAPGEPPAPDGKYVKISIRDTGMGIPAEHLPRIFDPYFTTKQRGSGLGLATSYSIVNKHNGRITVQSELGKGTTFSLYLPASSAPSHVVIEEREQPAIGTGRILIMDDEEGVRETAGSILGRLGYTFVQSEDGASAIEHYQQARDAGDGFDLVIMDLTIPGGMGGREAFERLKQIDPAVCAIVSSGYSNDLVMAEYEKHGFCGVVSKPYRIRDLGQAVQKALKMRDRKVASK